MRVPAHVVLWIGVERRCGALRIWRVWRADGPLAVRRSAGGIEGIVNGMDTNDWCPTQDKFLDVKYDEQTVVHGKAVAKETLQAELGLPVPRPAPHAKP